MVAAGLRTPTSGEVYQAIWQDVSDRYALFDALDIDWDAEGELYRPDDDASEDDLHAAVKGLLGSTGDNHVQLFADGYPPFSAGSLSSEGASSFVYDTVLSQLTVYEQSPTLLYGRYEGCDYLWIGSADNPTTRAARGVLRDHEGALMVDVRANPGGRLENAVDLARYLVDDEALFARHRRRIVGGGHEPWTDYRITPADNAIDEVVVLMDAHTASAGEVLAQAVVGQVDRIGEPTAGSLGARRFRDAPNGWLYGVSVTEFAGPNEETLEGLGVQPDVWMVDLDEDDPLRAGCEALSRGSR